MGPIFRRKTIAILFVCTTLFNCIPPKKTFDGFQPESYLGKSKEFILNDIGQWPVKGASPFKKGNKKKWHWVIEIEIDKQQIDVF
jgi:hypothetical protein